MTKVKVRRITTTLPLIEETPDNIPILIDDTSLAHYLGINCYLLWYCLRRATLTPAANDKSAYNIIPIKKRNGKTRLLFAPHKQLQYVQKKIRDALIDILPKDLETSVAYEIGSRCGNTSQEIAGAPVIIQLDIKNFFPSITQKKVKEFLSSVGYQPAVSELIAGILCVLHNGRRFLPQGGPASPMVANRVAESLIDPVVKRNLPIGWRYKRYCDNLYIWPENMERNREVSHVALLKDISEGIARVGFRTHKHKIAPYYRSQRVLGFTVNVKANCPKNVYLSLRATLHNCLKHGVKSQMYKSKRFGFKGETIENYISYLSGKVTYYTPYMSEGKARKITEALRAVTHIAEEGA